ncbi:MAG: hypothetical protein K6C94_02870 [Candidatus Gastranaerophilales bacterium]|nr:hypothetical protein [Candidatus Gastranaerophilales bacterium]
MMFDRIKKYLYALTHSKKYDNIIPLGYNCEIAYRFYKHFKFFDASLFGWSFVTFEQLKYSLLNMDKLCNGGIEYDYPSHTLKCKNSGIYFHGRTPHDKFSDNEQENQKIIEQDAAELQSRTEHLKEKFFNYANDGKKNLYIRKIHLSDGNTSDSGIEQKRNEILWIYNFLKDYCKNDFTFLLVVEEKFYDKFLFDDEKIQTRSILAYSPDDAVTKKKAGDPFGWKILFTEFQPKHKKKQKGKLKFELN